jgi:hypothetical protein
MFNPVIKQHNVKITLKLLYTYEGWRLLGCYAVWLRNVGSYKSHAA